MALPNTNSLQLDPQVIRDANMELATMSQIEMPKLRISLKMAGGAFGKFGNALRKGAEDTIFLTSLAPDESLRQISVAMEEMLMANLSGIERSALQVRLAIKKELSVKSKTQEQIEEIDKQISQSTSKEERKRLENSRKTIIEQATISERSQQTLNRLLKEFSSAVTDEERDLIQSRIDGQMEADKLSLKLLEERITKEKEINRQLVQDTKKLMRQKDSDTEKVREEVKNAAKVYDARVASIKAIMKETEALKTGIQTREESIQRTTGQYKKEFKGFVSEIFSKTFTGGIMGFLTGETGIGDLFGNAVKIGLEKTGVFDKKIGKTSVASMVFGPQSEEARKAAAKSTAQITGMRDTISFLTRETIKGQVESQQSTEQMVLSAEESSSSVREMTTQTSDTNAVLKQESKEESKTVTKDKLSVREMEVRGHITAGEIIVRGAEGGPGGAGGAGGPGGAGGAGGEGIAAANALGLGGAGGDAIAQMAQQAITPGSIFVHDMHSEKILQSMLEVMQGGSAKAKGSGGGGGVRGKISGAMSGIGNFLISIAEGVKAFGDTKVFKGAAGIALVGASLLPFAAAVTIIASSGIEAIAGTIAGMMALLFAVKLIGKSQGDILKGAFAMFVLGAALIPMAYALTIMGSVSVGALLASIIAIYALVGALMILGNLPVKAILIGAAALLVIGTTMIMVGAGLLMAGAGILLFSMAIERLAAIPFMDLMKAMMAVMFAVTVMTAAIGLMAIAATVAPLALLGIAMFTGGILLMGLALRTIPLEELTALNTFLTTLGENATKLYAAAGAIGALGLSLVVFAGAAALATGLLAANAVASAIGSLFGMGEVNILDQIFLLADKAPQLMQLASALNTIATAMQSIASTLTQFSGENIEVGMTNMTRLTEMQEPLAAEQELLQKTSIGMSEDQKRLAALQGDNLAGKIGQAVGGGSQVNSTMQTNIVGGQQNNMFMNLARNADPSILFSRDRYYSMIYR